MVDHDDPVGELVGLLQVLRREQQGRAVGDELADHVPHPQPAGRVEPGRRLVEEEHRRPGDEPGGEVEPAPHPAGVALHDPVGGVGELEPLEQLGGPGLAPRGGAGRESSPTITRFCRPVRSSSSVASWAVTPILRRTAAASAHDVVAGHPRPAAVGQSEGGEDPHRRRLPGAVRPEHAEDRSGRHREVDAGEGRVEPYRLVSPSASIIGVSATRCSLLVGRLG